MYAFEIFLFEDNLFASQFPWDSSLPQYSNSFFLSPQTLFQLKRMSISFAFTFPLPLISSMTRPSL